MSLTDYTENKLLDHFVRGNAASWTPPSSLNLKLYTASPDYETGSGGTEKTTQGGYTVGGQSVTSSSTNWNAPASYSNGYRVTNKQTASFSWTATADWSPGTIVGAALWDGSNMILGQALDTSRTVYNGDTIRFAADALKVDLDTSTAGGVSNYWKQAMLNHMFNLSSYSAPATAYLALFTTNPNFLTGSGGTEVSLSGTAYARLSVTMNSAWDAAASGIVDNTSAFTWSQATANWGDVIGAALVDTSSGAWTNMYAGDAFTAVTVNNGDTFSIGAGNFDITLT